MTGFAAIAFCAAFTSCSKGDDIYDPNRTPTTDNTNASYAEAFIKTFGKPAANQDWGFGTAKASTRYGNSGETYPQTHGADGSEGSGTEGGCNMNHNEWGDPDKEFGGWKVVDPLTDRQKEIVTAYFQNNKPGFKDPQWRHFFVQQVYGGGTATVGQTTEGITAANSSTYSSENMNLLTVGHSHIHINDFNKGDATTSTVLKTGESVNGGATQQDQVTLMVNIDDTSCFGYHETGSSTHHDNKAGLASWKTIAAWAVDHGYSDAYEVLDDGWNRSFLGFDLAIKEYDEVQLSTVAKYTDVQNFNNMMYAITGQDANGNDIIVPIKNPGTQDNGWQTTTVSGYDYSDEIKTADNKTINFITANTNQYVADGDPFVITDDSWFYSYKDVDEDHKNQMCLRLDRIYDLIDRGYQPVTGSAFKTWVKVGKSDGYFSDWIVTLTEAKRISTDPDPDPVYTIRVIGEDLSAQEEGDFDFNDVVFDVALNVPNKTYIKLKAAGGTLPLIVGVEEPQKGESYDANEVHHLFKQGTKTMINTRVSQKPELIAQGVSYADGLDDVILELDKAYENAKDIPVYVQKGGEWIELTAERGVPASKIGVTTNFRWVTETEFIGANNWYPLFTEWVTKNSGSWYQGDNEKK